MFNIIKIKAEMKNVTYLFAALVMVAALSSCQQDDSEIMLKKANSDEYGMSSPISFMGVVPQVIEGANNGGNRTCAEVAEWFETEFDFCGDRINFTNGMFDKAFPEGMKVTVTDGTFVAFEVPDIILIGDKYYKVGAVIVKGSNEANVYWYERGSFGDSKLAAPVNASGKPSGLSNLTFCLIEFVPEFPEVVMVMKTYLSPVNASYRNWAGTRGEGSDDNSLKLGYIKYYFKGKQEYPLYFGKWGEEVGKITAFDFLETGEHFLEVKVEITSGEWSFYESYLYAGSADGYDEFLVEIDGIFYTQYKSFPFVDEEHAAVRIFKINVDDLD
jgi:hypothetical protein